jgi:hypothetical protein
VAWIHKPTTLQSFPPFQAQRPASFNANVIQIAISLFTTQTFNVVGPKLPLASQQTIHLFSSLGQRIVNPDYFHKSTEVLII